MNAKSGAAGIVIRDDKILVMRRIKQGKEYYTFPGGSVEAGETPEQTVVREVDEETSIKAAVKKYIYYIKYDDGTDRHFFLCDYRSGEPRLRDDSPEAAETKLGDNVYYPMWVNISDLPKLLLYPLEVRDWVISDIPAGFLSPLRSAEMRLIDWPVPQISYTNLV